MNVTSKVGRITLSEARRGEALQFYLSSTNSVVGVPRVVTVPKGAHSTVFNITSLQQPTTITATSVRCPTYSFSQTGVLLLLLL